MQTCKFDNAVEAKHDEATIRATHAGAKKWDAAKATVAADVAA
jgi:hypothetical protein